MTNVTYHYFPYTIFLHKANRKLVTLVNYVPYRPIALLQVFSFFPTFFSIEATFCASLPFLPFRISNLIAE